MQGTLQVEQPSKPKQQFDILIKILWVLWIWTYSNSPLPCIKFGKRRGKQKAPVTTSCGFPDPLQNANLHKALPISNTFIEYQIHSSNIKYIQKIQTKNDSCTLLLLSRDNCGSRSITKRGVWFVVETSCKYMCGKIQKLKYILIFFIFPNTENWNVLSNWPNSAIGFTSLANDYYMLSQTWLVY